MDYLTLTAPFDGVITARNANTFDFVLPTTGDPTANYRSPDLSPSGAAAPIYVVDRTDIVRIFVDIPEQDANYVHIGTKATVLAKAYRDEPIPATVTRTSWALNIKSRTLRAEIDLPNPGSQLLPGMYAYVKVIIERPGVRALPEAALTYSGDKAYCWTHEDGHAVRTEVQTGVSDGEWIEVTNRQVPAARQRRGSVGADRRQGAGDPGRPVAPRRRRPRGDRSGRTGRTLASEPPSGRSRPANPHAGLGPVAGVERPDRRRRRVNYNRASGRQPGLRRAAPRFAPGTRPAFAGVSECGQLIQLDFSIRLAET